MLFAGLTLDLDFTLILVIALIAVPFLILNGIVFRPFLRVFEERYERIDGAVERARLSLDEAEAKAKSFEEKISAATKKGLAARAEIRNQAQDKVGARLDEARAELATKMKGALEQIDSGRKEALQAVQGEAEQLAELTANKLIGRGI